LCIPLYNVIGDKLLQVFDINRYLNPSLICELRTI